MQFLIKSTIEHPGQAAHQTQQKVQGDWKEMKRSIYFRYSDEQQVETMIRMSEQDALITRKGAVTMRLPLEKGVLREGTYDTEGIKMALTVDTLKLNLFPDERMMQFVYRLMNGEEWLGTYQLTIQQEEER